MALRGKEDRMIIRNPQSQKELKDIYGMSKSYTNNHQTWKLKWFLKNPETESLKYYINNKLIYIN